jgi:hypothetical protein
MRTVVFDPSLTSGVPSAFLYDKLKFVRRCGSKRAAPRCGNASRSPGPQRRRQATDRGLPFLEVLLGLREFLDVFGGVLERDELAIAGIGSSNSRDQLAMLPRRPDVGAAMIAHRAKHAWL